MQETRRALATERYGFSLIEMMIVVAIIAVMLGLTLAVTVGLSAQSDDDRAQKSLLVMDAALAEWEAAAERKLTYGLSIAPDPHGSGGESYDFDFNTYALTKPGRELLLGEVLKHVLRNESAAHQLAQIPGNLFTRNADGAAKIVDPWGQKIVVVFPGRNWRPSDPQNKKDLDGTIRTDYEEQLGICANQRILFVSTGPDHKTGDLELEQAPGSRNPHVVAGAADNLYSYPPLMETPEHSAPTP